jgi:UDP-glucose:glycoprotein glucosyltransferase
MFSFRQIVISLFTFILILEFHICLCKLVSVRLDSKWPSPPLLLELSEFLAKDSLEAFWKFVDTVTLHPLNDNVSEAEVYSKFVPLAAQYVPGQTARLMELALCLRAYTPGVAMQLSLADEHIAEALSILQLGSKVETLSPDDIWRKGRPDPPCDNFVFLHGEIICDPSHLESSLERLQKDSAQLAPVMLFKSDRIYTRHAAGGESQSAGAKLPIAILYGELGSAKHAAWHEKLKPLALSAALTYVHRHYFSVHKP